MWLVETLFRKKYEEALNDVDTNYHGAYGLIMIVCNVSEDFEPVINLNWMCLPSI